MITHKPVLQMFMPNAGEQGVIYAWVAGSPDVKEFKGTPLSRWGKSENSDFRKMVEALNTMHLTDLKTSHIISIMPNQRDYNSVLALMDSPIGSVSLGYGHPRIRTRVSTAGTQVRPAKTVETRRLAPRTPPAPARRVITVNRVSPEARVH